VQALAGTLGVTEAVTSPTFVIMKRYPLGAGQPFSKLIHIDAYRLESPEELAVLGFQDELNDPRNLICIEWAEKVGDLLPPEALRLRFDLDGERRTVSRLN